MSAAAHTSVKQNPTLFSAQSKRRGLGRSYHIDQDVHSRVILPENLEQRFKFVINYDSIDFRELEDVGHILLRESIVHGDGDRASSCYSVDTLQEGGGVGSEDADAAIAVLDEVVREAACAVGELGIRAAQRAAIGCEVVNGQRVGLDRGGSREEEGW